MITFVKDIALISEGIKDFFTGMLILCKNQEDVEIMKFFFNEARKKDVLLCDLSSKRLNDMITVQVLLVNRCIWAEENLTPEEQKEMQSMLNTLFFLIHNKKRYLVPLLRETCELYLISQLSKYRRLYNLGFSSVKVQKQRGVKTEKIDGKIEKGTAFVIETIAEAISYDEYLSDIEHDLICKDGALSRIFKDIIFEKTENIVRGLVQTYKHINLFRNFYSEVLREKPVLNTEELHAKRLFNVLHLYFILGRKKNRFYKSCKKAIENIQKSTQSRGNV